MIMWQQATVSLPQSLYICFNWVQSEKENVSVSTKEKSSVIASWSALDLWVIGFVVEK